MNDNKTKFLKTYANLPLGVRNEIIITIDEQTITWEVAFIEVKNNTKTGDLILSKLAKLDII